MRKLSVLSLMVAMVLVVALPAGADPGAKNTHFRGSAVYEWSDSFGDPYDAADDSCAPLGGDFAGFIDFTMRIEGDLQGCWYTIVDGYAITPSGAWKEHGREVFVADGSGDIFWTTYDFHAKFASDGSEIHGRCQHLVVAGTGMFAGAWGRLDFKDDVDAGINYYRGHMKLPAA